MKNLWIFALSVCYVSNLLGQKINVVNIEENRSMAGTWDYCKIEVRPFGDELRNYTYYRIGEVKSATDNKGFNLISENEESKEFKPIAENASLTLMKASRSATTITVEGTLQLYKPTEANGGIVKISDFRKKTEINLAPKTAPFTFHFYDKATMLKKNELDYYKRQEAIEKLPESERAVATELNMLISSLSYYSDEDLEKVLFFVAGGNIDALLGVEFEDAKGKKVSPVSSSRSNGAYTYFFEKKPDPSMKILINVESAKAIKNVPFVLKNIDLP